MLTICIATHQGGWCIVNCLNSIWQTLRERNFEIIIVDDCSEDNTVNALDELRGRVKLIRNTTRQGFAKCNNIASRAAGGELLCFLNDDIQVQPGWFEPMLAIFESKDDVGVIGNIQWSPRTGLYDHMGMVFSSQGIPCHFGRYFFFRPYRQVTRWGAVTAACWLIRKHVFLSAGGFDENFINGSEDIDLCLRLEQKGYSHYIANNSIIYHWVSSTPGRLDFEMKNQDLFMDRWGDILQKSWAKSDRYLYALNYLLRFLGKPWRYNFIKWLEAWCTMLWPFSEARSWFRP